MDKEQLIKKYRELDKTCSSFYNDINQNSLNNKSKYFLADNNNFEIVYNEYNQILDEIKDIESPNRVFNLIKNHLLDFMESVEFNLKYTKQHPELIIPAFNHAIAHFNSTNSDNIKELWEQLNDYVKIVILNKNEIIKNLSNDETNSRLYSTVDIITAQKNIACENYKKINDLKDRFESDEVDKISLIIKEYTKTLDELLVIIEDIVKEKQLVDNTDDRSVNFGADEYSIMLDKKFGVSLEELLDCCNREVNKTRDEIFNIASKIKEIEKTPQSMEEIVEIFNKYAGACESPDIMFKTITNYLKRTRKLAHSVMELPEDESCECVEIQECYKDSYPWGGYSGGDFTVRPFKGHMFLNQYNYKNITDGWLKINALHEAYPGHHIQYIKTAISRMPETIKIGAKYVPILEGTCLRTERTFEGLFSEDPFFPLFVAYRRHHAAVRILVDLELYYRSTTIEEATKIYQRELGFEYGTARKQIQAHINMPGYFTCYYYGMLKINEIEQRCNLSVNKFTSDLFSAGYISIKRLEEFFNLTEEEKNSYYNDFCSLCQDSKNSF